jgi:hypothetical protein
MRMESEGWILSLQIDNSLSHWRWQRAFIQLGNQWWWLWWQEARHACLIEEIRFAVNGAACHSCFSGTLGWRVSQPRITGRITS